ncbi:serine/threonine protein kinase [Hymenobacter roseosalivarius DSM 11622]|uniref:Serine/threonine protein kinase n=1 Tax=Hymenobacter roseosalivarius DSM 11622 TaxID=645990 RepID=A0A1W1VGF0_9BACT|nr:serine/threonine-protein kinase [Hymenobacter roseosalivarius]SMB92386.1 serine/threonine protein kinase [Hymenobacter roseosalivarius DSM 11622]
MTARRFYLSKGVSVHEHNDNFYIETITEEFKINRTIATFLGLLNEPKTPQELVQGLQDLTQGASTDVIEPLVSKFLKDMYRLEVVRKEGDTDIVALTPNYQSGAQIGQYLITDLLSQHNRYVQLYRATDCESGELVVLKMFSYSLESIGNDTRLAKGFRQFQQEFDIMRALPAHPNICALKAYHTEPYPYAVLEYLLGKSLSECAQHDTIIEDSKAHLATQILSSLAHIHANGIVHGDIHSHNFMVNADHVTMIDFGFSYRVGVSEQEQHINCGGVPTYLAPERIKQHNYDFSKQAADFRAEVYQIALVLFKLYYKELPFDGETWLERAASITTYDFGQHLSPSVPHEAVLVRALQKGPNERYASGQELLASWQQAIDIESSVVVESR